MNPLHALQQLLHLGQHPQGQPQQHQPQPQVRIGYDGQPEYPAHDLPQAQYAQYMNQDGSGGGFGPHNPSPQPAPPVQSLQAQAWNRHARSPLQGSADTGDNSGLIQEPGLIPYGGFQAAGRFPMNSPSFRAKPLSINPADFRDTQIRF